MITNIVKLMVVVNDDGSISCYTDTDKNDHPLNPDLRIYHRKGHKPIRQGYTTPQYSPHSFRETENE